MIRFGACAAGLICADYSTERHRSPHHLRYHRRACIARKRPQAYFGLLRPPHSKNKCLSFDYLSTILQKNWGKISSMTQPQHHLNDSTFRGIISLKVGEP